MAEPFRPTPVDEAPDNQLREVIALTLRVLPALDSRFRGVEEQPGGGYDRQYVAKVEEALGHLDADHLLRVRWGLNNLVASGLLD